MRRRRRARFGALDPAIDPPVRAEQSDHQEMTSCSIHLPRCPACKSPPVKLKSTAGRTGLLDMFLSAQAQSLTTNITMYESWDCSIGSFRSHPDCLP
ncbi:hypothetical protein Bca52824_017514 [Brassica carinata]|uniref:Uncharacterized protein n=1 Tax=Brassica carinata TaxID=52824 RepID=A0A8X8AXG2_BRACI|nr:hypothetical protein Bca52824_017514 [Brassica carinata]